MQHRTFSKKLALPAFGIAFLMHTFASTSAATNSPPVDQAEQERQRKIQDLLSTIPPDCEGTADYNNASLPNWDAKLVYDCKVDFNGLTQTSHVEITQRHSETYQDPDKDKMINFFSGGPESDLSKLICGLDPFCKYTGQRVMDSTTVTIKDKELRGANVVMQNDYFKSISEETFKGHEPISLSAVNPGGNPVDYLTSSQTETSNGFRARRDGSRNTWQDEVSKTKLEGHNSNGEVDFVDETQNTLNKYNTALTQTEENTVIFNGYGTRTWTEKDETGIIGYDTENFPSSIGANTPLMDPIKLSDLAAVQANLENGDVAGPAQPEAGQPESAQTESEEPEQVQSGSDAANEEQTGEEQIEAHIGDTSETQSEESSDIQSGGSEEQSESFDIESDVSDE